MKLTKFKESNHKKLGIILFTICSVLLVTVVFLYKSFAIFETNESKNIINGQVQDPGDLYFAFYVNDVLQKDMPKQEEGYVLDEEKSYCGVAGQKNSNIKVFVTKDNMIQVSGVTTSRTKCNLYFVKGIFLLGKGVPIVETGEGLYEVKHEGVSGTTHDDGFSKTEYRYAGSDPKNYILFNNEPWRIIGLVNVMTDEDTVEQRVKIVKKESIGNYAWNTENTNDWTNASLMKLLNGNYYHQTNEFIETGINEFTRNMIDEDVIWNIGGSNVTNIVVSEFYQKERGATVYNSQLSEWKKEENNFHGIGLMYPSDFWLATSGGNLGREKCFEYSFYEKDAPGWDFDHTGILCRDNDWLKPSNSNLLWTLTSSSQNNVVYVIDSGHIGNNIPNTSGYFVLPTLYLKTNVKILNDSNDGSSENPYKLGQIFYYE